MFTSDLAHLKTDSTLADLPSQDYQVGPSTLGHEVAAEFERRADLPGVIVRTDDALAGMISRQTFFHQMSRLFSREIYLKRPIQVFLNAEVPAPLCLPADCRISEAASRALDRPQGTAYEPLVIEFPDGRLELLDAYVLLLAQARLLEMANRIIQNQKDAAEAANKAKSIFLANMSHVNSVPFLNRTPIMRSCVPTWGAYCLDRNVGQKPSSSWWKPHAWSRTTREFANG